MTIRLEVPVSINGEWEQMAACRGHDPTLFFGPNRFEPKRERLAREAAAKEVCRRCPVRQPCREHALTFGETFGVWGGLGEAERRGATANRGTLARRAG